MNWITHNLGTILITLALIAIVALILRSLWKNRHQGCSSCGGSCGGACASCPACCHSPHQPSKKS